MNNDLCEQILTIAECAIFSFDDGITEIIRTRDNFIMFGTINGYQFLDCQPKDNIQQLISVAQKFKQDIDNGKL